MKKWINKQTVLAFILGALIFSAIPASAAIQEYLLYPTESKLVVDGEEYNNPDLPLMSYKGYNYLPAAAFKDICAKIGVNFQWVGDVKQIQISTPTASVTSTPAAADAIETKTTPDGLKAELYNGEWYIYNGFPTEKWLEDFKAGKVSVKYSIAPIVIKGQENSTTAQLIKNPEKYIKVNGHLQWIEPEVVLDNIPLYTITGASYVKYSYYVDTILPLIK
jgi:hypothetical protein